MENVDTPATCELLLAHLKLARGDLEGATKNIENAEQFVSQNNFAHRIPDVVAAQVLVSLHQGNLAEAAELADKHKPSYQPGSSSPGSGRRVRGSGDAGIRSPAGEDKRVGMTNGSR